MKIFIVFLTFLGAVFLALIVCGITEAMSTAIRERRRKKRKEYEYKHRFDKPPTAECYCVDCWYMDKEENKCRRYEIYVAEDWFCKGADPN